MPEIYQAIPLLHVSNVARAVKFYTETLGFSMIFVHPPDSFEDPCYCGIQRDGVQMHLSSHSGDGVAGSVVILRVRDGVDALHAEFAAKGAPVDASHPVDQTWGTRETFFRDPDGNSICFQQPAFRSQTKQ